MAGGRRAACLLVTNLFPPALGGSSEVYAALATFARDEIAVLTSSHDYETGLERQGWPAFDQHAAYPIARVKCVRPYVRRLYPGSGRYRLHEACTALKLIAAVIRLVIRHHVRTICIADDETVGWLTLLGKALGLRTLIYCHGDDLKCAKEMVSRRARWFRFANVVVAASKYAGDLLSENFGVATSKIAIIRNGVDLGAFFPTEPSAQVRRQYRLEGHRVIVTVTRLVPRKGVDKVLEALPPIAHQFPDILYVVVGDGPQRRDLEKKAEALGVSGRVRFVGAVAHAQIRDFYNVADLVLLPNREDLGEADGLPLVFLEANACGKPVIGGRAGGTPEIVRDGENGMLVDGQDSTAIATAVSELLANPERRLAMGRRGLEMAQHWNWAARAEAFLQLCRN